MTKDTNHIHKDFKSIKEVLIFVFNEIDKRIDRDLILSSKLELHLQNSKKSVSHYLVLKFKDEYSSLDPLYGSKFPYNIRMSDHAIQGGFKLFPNKFVDFNIHINVQLNGSPRAKLRAAKKEWSQNSIDIYTKGKEFEQELLIKREDIRTTIGSFRSMATYSFNADLDIPANNIISILKKNQI